MKKRNFGKEAIPISEVGLGCWQLGGAEWGEVDNKEAAAILETSYENGVTFYDTADVYGMGRSEKLVGEFLKSHRDDVFVATKVGRTPDLYPDGYGRESVTKCIEGSLKRLGVDSLDLVQTHCVPEPLMRSGEIFTWLSELRQAGKIKRFGASVETMDEALLCLENDEVYSLQIIFNIFRQKALEKVLPLAREKQVGIIVRLPLNSGMLSGKFNRNTQFDGKDHRNFNKDGDSFYVGETFGGLVFTKGIELVEELNSYVPHSMPMAQFALRWCLDQPGVSTVIPGATKMEQARNNAAASDMAPLSSEALSNLANFYQDKVLPHIRGPY